MLLMTLSFGSLLGTDDAQGAGTALAAVMAWLPFLLLVGVWGLLMWWFRRATRSQRGVVKESQENMRRLADTVDRIETQLGEIADRLPPREGSPDDPNAP